MSFSKHKAYHERDVFWPRVSERAFAPDEAARLFSGSTEIRVMMLTLGGLARVQAECGVMPKGAGAAINRAVKESDQPLERIIRTAHDLPEGLVDPARHMSMVPDEDRAFATAVLEL